MQEDLKDNATTVANDAPITEPKKRGRKPKSSPTLQNSEPKKKADPVNSEIEELKKQVAILTGQVTQKNGPRKLTDEEAGRTYPIYRISWGKEIIGEDGQELKLLAENEPFRKEMKTKRAYDLLVKTHCSPKIMGDWSKYPLYTTDPDLFMRMRNYIKETKVD